MSNLSFNAIDRDVFRKNLNKYTRKAFQILPELDEPYILDIGCGSGVPTLELARLTNGKIIGLDINQSLLEKLSQKIKEAGLSDRLKAMQASLLELDFENGVFDIIWSEGSIWIIGFEKGLKEWRRLLKPAGFLVVHDEIKDLTQKLQLIPSCGFRLLGHFHLTEDIWRSEYYEPLEKEVHKKRMRIEHTEDHTFQILDKEEQEIMRFKENPKQFASVFFILQKA